MGDPHATKMHEQEGSGEKDRIDRPNRCLDLHGFASRITLHSVATIAETSEGLQGQSRWPQIGRERGRRAA